MIALIFTAFIQFMVIWILPYLTEIYDICIFRGKEPDSYGPMRSAKLWLIAQSWVIKNMVIKYG